MVSQFEDPFSEANSTARLAFVGISIYNYNNNNNNNNFLFFFNNENNFIHRLKKKQTIYRFKNMKY